MSWSNDQKFLTMTMSKISKLPWSNGQNWPFLTITMAKVTKLSRSNGQNWPFVTIDHGVNSRVSWSWSVPYPPFNFTRLQNTYITFYLQSTLSIEDGCVFVAEN